MYLESLRERNLCELELFIGASHDIDVDLNSDEITFRKLKIRETDRFRKFDVNVCHRSDSQNRSRIGFAVEFDILLDRVGPLF